jgi:hypothetical protein
VGDGIDETIRHPSKWRRRALIGAFVAVVVVGGGGYVAGHLMTSKLLPARTEIQGVPVGGLDRDQAQAKVQQALAPVLERPVRISSGGTTASLNPAASGLSVDWQATMAQVDPADSWSPRAIWNSLRGGARVGVVSSVDQKQLNAAVSGQSARFLVGAQDATVRLEGTRIVTRKAVQGRTLDAAATAGSIAGAWPRTDPAPIPAAVTHRDPAITDAEAAKGGRRHPATHPVRARHGGHRQGECGRHHRPDRRGDQREQRRWHAHRKHRHESALPGQRAGP